MRIGTIVEGPTDRLLLKAIMDEICPGEHEYRDLQPADVGDSFGERGAGWKGVRRFCFDVWQQLSASIADFIADYEIDLLVIHIDADIANEVDLQEGLGNLVGHVAQPCPPISLTTDKLREVVAQWLNLESVDQFPQQVVLAIPAQDSENWVFAALFPDHALCQQPGYECVYPPNSRQHPAYLLTLPRYGRILRRRGGEIKKPRRNYQFILSDVIGAWDDVCGICAQAQSFSDELVGRL